jgi:hypothetical protein
MANVDRHERRASRFQTSPSTRLDPALAGLELTQPEQHSSIGAAVDAAPGTIIAIRSSARDFPVG